ncbi:MAG: hypothetical protein ACOYU7_02170 [Bacillota bacterium]
MPDTEKRQFNKSIPEPMPPEPQGVGFSEDLANGLGWMYATDTGLDNGEVTADDSESPKE